MVWIGLLVAASVIEARAMKRHSGTASEAIATLFRTETQTGRAVYLGTLMITAAWMARHITTFRYTETGR